MAQGGSACAGAGHGVAIGVAKACARRRRASHQRAVGFRPDAARPRDRAERAPCETSKRFSCCRRCQPSPPANRRPNMTRRARHLRHPSRFSPSRRHGWSIRNNRPRAVHGLLFNCTPENLANLSPQELRGLPRGGGAPGIRSQCRRLSPITPIVSSTPRFGPRRRRAQNAPHASALRQSVSRQRRASPRSCAWPASRSTASISTAMPSYGDEPRGAAQAESSKTMAISHNSATD